ncbi:hypothetical protein F7725_006014 [Dissostichus mawsoni]|uniref:Uncharacterized protein n=1 Tax=Dissostichus mawsoni TaxID=36200 RepID=A0A7J5YV89_DISMA|nr:hypothetical protein F7725_006014 [Dissostichus mawsoni]
MQAVRFSPQPSSFSAFCSRVSPLEETPSIFSPETDLHAVALLRLLPLPPSVPQLGIRLLQAPLGDFPECLDLVPLQLEVAPLLPLSVQLLSQADDVYSFVLVGVSLFSVFGEVSQGYDPQKHQSSTNNDTNRTCWCWAAGRSLTDPRTTRWPSLASLDLVVLDGWPICDRSANDTLAEPRFAGLA